MRFPIKILMWVENHFPQDTRVRNEAALLTDAGYKVAVIALRKQGQPRPKQSDVNDETKKSAAKPGIISKLAGLVGLGSGTPKKAAKKAPAKKKAAAAKRPTQAGESSRAAVSKRPSTKRRSKPASSSRSSGGSKKQSGVRTTKKSTRKRANRK